MSVAGWSLMWADALAIVDVGPPWLPAGLFIAGLALVPLAARSAARRADNDGGSRFRHARGFGRRSAEAMRSHSWIVVDVIWRVRRALALDHVPAQLRANSNNGIVNDMPPRDTSASGYAHPCEGTKSKIAEPIHAGLVAASTKAMQ